MTEGALQLQPPPPSSCKERRVALLALLALTGCPGPGRPRRRWPCVNEVSGAQSVKDAIEQLGTKLSQGTGCGGRHGCGAVPGRMYST